MKFLFRLILFVILAVAVVAYFYLNTFFKTKAEEIASSMTGTKVEISYVAISPFSGNIAIGGISVANPSGFKSQHAIKFSSITASVDIKSALTDVVKIKNVTLKNPVIFYEIGVNGDNIRKLLGNVNSGKSSRRGAGNTNGSTTKKKVVIEKLDLIDTKVELAANLFGLEAGQDFNVGNIHLTNIGGTNSGTQIENVTTQVLRKIIAEISELKASGFTDQLNNIQMPDVDTKKLGKDIEDSVKGLENLF
jgi:uncharacterized protein involved in outer membrane biogenesis